MLLSDRTIRALLDSGDVKLVPEPKDVQFQPISVDLRLGMSFCRPAARGEDEHSSITSFTLIRPGEFVLASTAERLVLPNHIAGIVHGKSTWARKGLMVEAAGLVDPGFDGTITLEMKNLSASPIPLSAGVAICQLTLHAIDTAVLRPYGSPGLASHYQGQTRAEPAR
jgi:dCTP deaminase